MNEAVNLTNCDREPIHIPGSVQPFGFLLTVLSDFTICMASDNVGNQPRCFRRPRTMRGCSISP
ncbi:light-regulated signal transduction histidine kinase (bacteriophytochrome) [Bradyrhizobium japonicum]|jgi:light-regulated signal transduction histidine kinase (bacteriophytochrome)|uniref:hypothetical protein n=1 Tax=Bradyrhizobium japonicum TaxID=375 RepID=UPI0003F4E2A9|nr:light-regulated signal transduction histidine kinase (bacteriophytochrome) [Bradyrhizobium japonicum]MCP1777222.1 light-regulated signal transduction histidine kinase (bacteriophytochrome) [Bradyrhizobium japonicum]MCP1856709.1 light-regulated signal transduction histidine kinase (bacteriophytochrome) [Bradyrhizobium japonicum]MCP1887524.1 light-regulated signal transduction histidine kinase (bacteriophytochrome) [Bradyrhizobium japonicum]MCP1959778.1 light-regulated signal transduction hist